MILNKDTILEEVKFPNGLDTFQVNSHSIDLRVNENIVMSKGDHYIAKTLDVVELPKNIMAIVFPRSSLNRMKATLDVTGVVDPGYLGTLILPLTAHTDIYIPKGTRIASLIFYRTEDVTDVRVSKYHGSDGALKPDKTEETSLLESGDVDMLKQKYKV